MTTMNEERALAEKLRTDAIAIFGEGQAERDIIEWFYAALLAAAPATTARASLQAGVPYGFMPIPTAEAMSNVKRLAHTVEWEGLQMSAAYMAINDGGEYVMHADYAALEVERDALRQQRDKLAKVLEDVEREHDLIRRMKNCEIHRGRGSFGIAVMSDPPALEWQALDKELQQFVDARRAALAASTGQEVGK